MIIDSSKIFVHIFQEIDGADKLAKSHVHLQCCTILMISPVVSQYYNITTKTLLKIRMELDIKLLNITNPIAVG